MSDSTLGSALLFFLHPCCLLSLTLSLSLECSTPLDGILCVCVNSCALRTSQAPMSFVSVISQPSSMLKQTIKFARRQSIKKTAKASKENHDLRKARFACDGLHFSFANFQEVEPVLKTVYAFAMCACSVGREMVKSGRGLARRSVQFCAVCFPWRSPKDDDFRDTSGVVMQRFQLGPGCLEFSRVPGIIASLALTKTLALICDIRRDAFLTYLLK